MGCALPLLLWLVAGGANAQQQQLRLLAEWREAEYEFPSAAERQRALDTQEYVPGNGVPIDVDIDYGGMCKTHTFYGQCVSCAICKSLQ